MRTHQRLALVPLILLLPACAPSFSDLQSARLVGPGRVEITPSYTSANFTEDGDTEGIQDQIGIRFATGLTAAVDLRARYEYVTEGAHILGAGPKFGLSEDRLALYTPIGFAIGDFSSSETWQLQPTLLFTHSFSDRVEVTTSGRGVVWLNSDADNLVGGNIGLGLSNDLTRWALRPEIGFLRNPGEDGTMWQWSLGFTLFPGSD